MSKNEKISQGVIVAGLIAFAYYKFSKMTASEKQKVYADIKEIGEKVLKDLAPEGLKNLAPSIFK